MPSLDMTAPDNFTPRLQLFFAAHPDERMINEEVRAHAGLPGESFLCAESCRRLVAWARQRHLIRRPDAARLLELSVRLFQHPRDVVALTPRGLGTPSRRQPTVLSTDIVRWLYACEPEEDTECLACTLEAARRLLATLRDDASEAAAVRGRGHELLDWLAAQPAS